MLYISEPFLRVFRLNYTQNLGSYLTENAVCVRCKGQPIRPHFAQMIAVRYVNLAEHK
jgi:hypothetical protein